MKLISSTIAVIMALAFSPVVQGYQSGKYCKPAPADCNYGKTRWMGRRSSVLKTRVRFPAEAASPTAAAPKIRISLKFIVSKAGFSIKDDSLHWSSPDFTTESWRNMPKTGKKWAEFTKGSSGGRRNHILQKLNDDIFPPIHGTNAPPLELKKSPANFITLNHGPDSQGHRIFLLHSPTNEKRSNGVTEERSIVTLFTLESHLCNSVLFRLLELFVATVIFHSKINRHANAQRTGHSSQAQ
ncbi:hypothetical protein E2P81_ATG00434 [Venturia nashicola]|nr:hypothetical protein E2P81_ATG00434 [Venturia nashicola]